MRKALVLLLALSLIGLPAMAQSQTTYMSSKDYTEGRLDGEADATGNQIWLLGGCLLGVVGVLLAYVIEPEVPSGRLIGKSPAYIQGYTEGYKSATKRKNAMYALYGMLAWLVFLIVYYVAVIAAVSSATYLAPSGY